MERVVFLDRDGVINEDSADYIKSWEEFRFIPGSISAIRQLTKAGYSQIIITNQSAVNRHFITPTGLETLHQKMISRILSQGGQIRDVYYCPHIPDDRCDCRKPKPGLIERAVRFHQINPADSVMIGDSAKDIECGVRAGCARTILVLTGNGEIARNELARKKILPTFIAKDLHHAANWVISHG